MSRDDQPPRDPDPQGTDPRGSDSRRADSRGDRPQGGFVSDLRDSVGKKVSANEGGIRDRLGKAARWVDQRTGGKYSAQIGRAESAVGEGVGRLAAQDRPAGAGPAARPADTGFAGSDAPTPPEGTRMPGARPADVRDDAPTGPIPPVPAAPGAAAGGVVAGGAATGGATSGTTPGATEPLVDPAGPTGATERLRPGATEPLRPGATEPLRPAVDADPSRPPHQPPSGTA